MIIHQDEYFDGGLLLIFRFFPREVSGSQLGFLLFRLPCVLLPRGRRKEKEQRASKEGRRERS